MEDFMDSKKREEKHCLNMEEIVISGVSGKFPESDNLQEFQDNLFAGVDMITDDGRRWPPGLLGLPARSGKIKTLDKFDTMFFGVNSKLANFMDPQLRILHEITFEAILDAGVNPSTIRGKNIGVFVGTSVSESETIWTQDPENVNGYPIVGCNKAMFANRISFAFDLQGPSFTVDTACSSSLLALEQAVASIRMGHCEAAIVAGVHLCLSPMSCINTHRLHMLSSDGKCRSFDASGKGYVRSEAVVAIFIQRKNSALRSYCSIVHAKTSTDGYKELGVTFPSGERQAHLLQSVYSEAGIDPKEVTYVEAHGTGTQAGDPQELGAISAVFCKEKRNPLIPLLVGSVKSNMGHSEPSSGLCSVTKVLLAMKMGQIPANLHFRTPNPDIPSLIDGRVKVVCHNIDWDRGLVGVNSFGFGGSNVHVILESNKKLDPGTISSNLPLLVPFSGRTRESVEFALQSLTSKPSDESDQQKDQNLAESSRKPDQELISLLHQIHQNGIPGHGYRGYSVVKTDGELLDLEVKEVSASSIKNGKSHQIWYIFNGMGAQWPAGIAMARDLMTFPVFATSIQNSSSFLKNIPEGSSINLIQLLCKGARKSEMFEPKIDIVETFVSIVSIQIALIDLLTSLDLHADGFIGHSLGELACAYADGCFTHEQTILAALYRGLATVEGTQGTAPGAMAAVGLTWEQAKIKCSEGIHPACHNSSDSVTVSGPSDQIKAFVDQLKAEDIFAKEIDTNGLAFHSEYISAAAPIFQKSVEQLLPKGSAKLRSSRWISSSIPQSRWTEDLAILCSGEYHANNMTSPVLFKEALEHVPEHSVVIEIGPHCLLQALLKRSLPQCSHVGLMNKNHPNNSIYLLNSVGKLFILGLNPKFSNLYQKMEFPVSVQAASLSPLIKWDHSNSFNVAHYSNFQGNGTGFAEIPMEISLRNEAEQFYQGHKIDGRLMFPATGYLLIIWKAFAQTQGRFFDQTEVVLEQVKIQRATFLPQNGSPVKFSVNIFQGSGEFQVQESGFVVMSGVVRSPRENVNEFIFVDPPRIPETEEERETAKLLKHPDHVQLSSEDIYKELRLRGYEYSGAFRGIQQTDPELGWAKLEWRGNWASFLDTMLQMIILTKPSRALYLPSYIDKVVLEPQRFLDSLKPHIVGRDIGDNGHFDDDDDENTDFPFEDEENAVKIVPVYYYDNLKVITCEGVQFQRFVGGIAPRKNQDSSSLKLETYKFTPYFDDDDDHVDPVKMASKEECLRTFAGIVSENISDIIIKIAWVAQQSSDTSIVKCLYEFIQGQPMRKCSGTVIVPPESNKTVVSNSANPTPDSEQKDSNLDVLTNLGLLVRSPVDQSEMKHFVEEAAAQNDLIAISGNDTEFLQDAANSLKDRSFLLVHSSATQKGSPALSSISFFKLKFNLTLVSLKISKSARFYLFKRRQNNSLKIPRSIVAIEIDVISQSADTGDFLVNYGWVNELKAAMSNAAATESESPDGSSYSRIFLITQEPSSGVIGLVNSLRLEPGGQGVRCFFLRNSRLLQPSLRFNFQKPDGQLQKILRKDLVMNVLEQCPNRQNPIWGSFRFQPLQPLEKEDQDPYKIVQHAYVNMMNRGDLSSLRWFESPLRYYKNQSEICSVYYAALNFRDVMLATGKLSLDALPNNIGLKSCVLGMEFSGKLPSGKRIMGLLPSQALATSVVPSPGSFYTVPKNWTLSQAATIPVAYSTAFYALIVRGNLRTGESVLIHAGAGGVGLAALRVALSVKCKVFTTVSSQEKRDFLKKTFPQLSDSCFANSRDTTFLEHILEETKGRGVDLVLNSLSEDKLHASIKCLAQHGRFLEIGKMDLFRNTSIGLAILLKNVSVHGILFDSLVSSDKDTALVRELMKGGLRTGVVAPLPSTIFEDNDQDIEKAFRLMAVGKHMGKILIQIRKEDTEIDSQKKVVKAFPLTYFDPQKSYIVVGGLGGFGLELCSWMISRGVTKLVVSSRSGVKTGYQSYCLQKWRNEGATVVLSTKDVSTLEGASKVLEAALISFSGCRIGGIWNLAMVLRDGLIQNQTPEKFEAVSRPKVVTTLALDKVSKQLAPHLEYFVCFSSAYSGRGGPGLANYAYANSFMERVCERRRKEGLPGLAIQWAAVGDVGVLVDNKNGGNEKVVGGTLPQRIQSCLNTLDVLLGESRSIQDCTLASLVIPEKRRRPNGDDESKLTLAEKVAHILGMKVEDIEQQADKKLYELGMDSLMGVEIKQLIEMTTPIILTQKDVIELTFAKIKEMKISVGVLSSSPTHSTTSDTNKNTPETPKKLDSPTVQKIANGISGKNDNHMTITIDNESTPPDLENKRCSLKSSKSLESVERVPKSCLSKFKAVLRSIVLYMFGLAFALSVAFFYLISLLIRQLFRGYLKVFYDSSKIRMIDKPCDELLAMNPRTSNVIFTTTCRGVPYKSRIIKTLDERLVNWRTNICLDKETTPDDPLYTPYEGLRWRIEEGLFFHYWVKDLHFNVRNHIVYETCDPSTDLTTEALRISEFYHNHKWAETDQQKMRPQWEVRIVIPKYGLNFPKDQKEFLVVVAVHHVYGDAFSGLHMLQYAFSDQKLEPSIIQEQINGPDSLQLESVQVGAEKKDGDLENVKTPANISPKKSLFKPVRRLHQMIVEISRMAADCRHFKDYCKEDASARQCGLAKFSLSQLKSIKNTETGTAAALTAVVLTCASAAYEELYARAKIEGRIRRIPKKICAVMPYSVFPYKRLGLLNNFSGAMVPLPVGPKNVVNIGDRLIDLEKKVEVARQRDKLIAMWNLSYLFSFLTIQVSKLFFYNALSPALIYTNVPAIIPRNFTFFGGYTVNEFFGFTALINRAHGTLTSVVDSETDTVALSFVVDESVLDVSPTFLQDFFNIFQEKIDQLVKDSNETDEMH